LKAFFFLCLLVIGIMVAVLQWTGGPAAGHGGVQLVWATDDNPVRQEQMALFRDWYRKEFGAPIDIRIDPANSDQTKVIVQSVAGAGPDLFDVFGRVGLQTIIESGIVYDITDAAAKGGFGPDRFWPVLRDNIVFAERQYAVPDNAVSPLIVVNQEMLEQKGLKLPGPGWNWNDLLALAQALTLHDAGGRVTRYGLLSINWENLIFQNGGAFFNDSGTRCIFNSPQTVAALQFYHDLEFKYHVMPTTVDRSSMSSQGGYGSGNVTLFTGQRGAMLDFARYIYIVINQTNRERAQEGQPPLRIMPLPPLTGIKPLLIAGARCTAINRRSRHVTEALRFLQFLTSKEFNDQINRSADSLNATAEFARSPAGVDITGGRPSIAGCDSPLWVQATLQSVSTPGSVFVSGPAFTQIVTEESDRLENNLQSPAETAARIQDRVNAAMARYLALRPALKRQWQDLEAVAPAASAPSPTQVQPPSPPLSNP
jgi:ABC-type glycerol-3-phosphate transport system substrate-binding protein